MGVTAWLARAAHLTVPFPAWRGVSSRCAQIFEDDSEEVHREWVKYTQKIDKKLEDALRHTVKRSLQELSKLLNGDKKTEVRMRGSGGCCWGAGV